ncbi:MAG: RNA 2',3'-cyclic phosphodiesterase [Candidatus Gygaella obscura]|nr:RNA 2',3'-cyclic phosphodiesterase [Candidatus Gygaella obscura]
MRSFIAIELDKKTIAVIKEIQKELKKSCNSLKLIKPKNIHITLKFLGDINEKQYLKIKSILSSTAKEFSWFKLNISKIGCFPNYNSARIVWLGIENEKHLSSMAGEISSKINKTIDTKDNRPFKTHITIARLKNKSKDINKELFFKLTKINCTMNVDKIALIKSTLTTQGSIYEKLYEVNLKTI